MSRVKSRAFFRAREKFVKKRLVSFGSNTINFTDANYATLWAWWRKKNRKKMEWISNSETNSYEINLSDHETRLILARSSFSTNFPDHANTLMLIIIARFFLESNTTISRSYRKRERERKHLHPAVTSVYVTSVTREQAPHGCGTQWCEFSKDVLQYARRRGGEEEEEEARSLIWINKGAIIRGAFGDSFTRHIFASRFNPSLQQLLPFPFCGNDAVHPWTIGREAPGAWINSRGSTSVHLVISLYEFQFFLSFFFFRFVLCIQKELSLFRWKKWKKKKSERRSSSVLVHDLGIIMLEGRGDRSFCSPVLFPAWWISIRTSKKVK